MSAASYKMTEIIPSTSAHLIDRSENVIFELVWVIKWSILSFPVHVTKKKVKSVMARLYCIERRGLWFSQGTLVSVKGHWLSAHSGSRSNYCYYLFKIFPRFWLAKRTRLIHHNRLLMTKFGRNLTLTRKWRQKCSVFAG